MIDEVVAGQLWIQICEHDPTDATYVAKNILSRVERETMAELGIGDLAKRRDPAWAAAVLRERYDESIAAAESEDVQEPREQLAELLRRALDSGTLSDVDRDLLLDLAHAANAEGAPLRRGERGLRRHRSLRWSVRITRWLLGRSDVTLPMLDCLAEVARHRGLAL